MCMILSVGEIKKFIRRLTYIRQIINRILKYKKTKGFCGKMWLTIQMDFDKIFIILE